MSDTAVAILGAGVGSRIKSHEPRSFIKIGDKTLIDPTGKVNTPDFAQVSKDYKKPASYK